VNEEKGGPLPFGDGGALIGLFSQFMRDECRNVEKRCPREGGVCCTGKTFHLKGGRLYLLPEMLEEGRDSDPKKAGGPWGENESYPETDGKPRYGNSWGGGGGGFLNQS